MKDKESMSNENFQGPLFVCSKEENFPMLINCMFQVMFFNDNIRRLRDKGNLVKLWYEFKIFCNMAYFGLIWVIAFLNIIWKIITKENN